MSDESIELSIVIPVFNGEKTVVELYFRLTKILNKLEKSYEIIFIDDGSKDRTYELLQDLHQKDNRIKIIKLLKNFGQHPALIAGFQQVNGKIIITLNGTLDDPPEVIPEFLAKLKGDDISSSGYHVVVGYRDFKTIGWHKRIIINLTNHLFSKLTGVTLKDYDCLFGVYKKSVIDMLLQCRERTCSLNPLVSWLGVSIVEMETTGVIKTQGFLKLLGASFNLLTSFSPFTIQIMSLTGIAIALLTFILGILLAICGYVGRISFEGIIIFLILFSFQLAGIGLIGRYLGQIYVQIQGRPYYIIEEIIE